MKKTFLLAGAILLSGTSVFLVNSSMEKVNDTVTMKSSYSNGENMELFEESEEEEDASEEREEASDTKPKPATVSAL